MAQTDAYGDRILVWGAFVTQIALQQNTRHQPAIGPRGRMPEKRRRIDKRGTDIPYNRPDLNRPLPR